MALYLIFITIAGVLDIFGFLMLIRAVLSWFVQPDSGNRLFEILDTMTEFVVAPVRNLMERFDFVRRVPLDISFFVAFLLVQMLSGIFSGVAPMFL